VLTRVKERDIIYTERRKNDNPGSVEGT